MCAVSAAMNWLFLSSLGKSPLEGQVLGAASVAADLLKALLPFFIAWSWQARRFLAAGAGSLAFAFFAGFSFLSAIGFAADNRLVLVDRRGDAASAYERVQRDLASLESQRAALARHRPPAVVAEEIERHRQNRRWVSTNECTAATEPQSRDYCGAYFTLRAELAAGREGTRLTSAITALQSEASQLRRNGAGQDNDPQVSLVARILAQEPEPVRLALIIAVALLVEIGASLGLFLASGHDGIRPAQNPVPDSPLADPLPEVGAIEDFCLEALMPSKGGVMSDNDLLAAYRDWCAAKSLLPLERDRFLQAFAALADAIELPCEAGGHRGIDAVQRYRPAA